MGFTLKYTGQKFNDSNINSNNDTATTTSNLAQFRELFSNIGALTIRFQLSQAQYAALIQQIVEANYLQHDIDMPAEGASEKELFHKENIDLSKSLNQTKLLEEYSHYPIGRGKILNERGQKLKHPNLENLQGGQHIWDNLHFAVWSVGLNLSSQLSQQGFYYICCPATISATEYQTINDELHAGFFTVVNDDSKIIAVETQSGTKLDVMPVPTNQQIFLDPAHKQTTQPNGFLVKNNQDQKTPVGWIFHENNKKLVKQTYAEDLLRIIRTSKSGFHLLSLEEKDLLQGTGLVQNQGFNLFTQNGTFNAMDVIFEELQKEYGFNPTGLLNASKLGGLCKRVQSDSNTSETILILHLMFEMIQPFVISQREEFFSTLPLRLQNSFVINENTLKAISYAFDLKNKAGEPILSTSKDKKPYENCADLIDVKINGNLIDPDFSDPKNSAAVLATAILITEQLLLSQLLRIACQYSDDHPYAKILRSVLGNDFYLQLRAAAKLLPSNNEGPILGLQFEHCEKILSELREHLGFNHLINLATELQSETQPISLATREVKKSLQKLVMIADLLQSSPGFSAVSQCSRGINAGLIPFAKKFMPDLPHLNLLVKEPITEIPTHSTRQIQSENITACPFLNKKIQSASTEKEKVNFQPQKNNNGGSWAQLFTRVSSPVISTVETVESYLNRIPIF